MNSGNDNQELLAYLGMEITALTRQGYTSRQTKHIIVGQLMSAIIETIAVTDDNQLDLYALMPLFVSFKFLVDEEIKRKEPDSYIPLIKQDIERLKGISEYIGHRIDIIKQLPMED